MLDPVIYHVNINFQDRHSWNVLENKINISYIKSIPLRIKSNLDYRGLKRIYKDLYGAPSEKASNGPKPKLI